MRMPGGLEGRRRADRIKQCGVSGRPDASIGSLRLVKENTGLKVISMVRPRGAGFSYTEAETEQMFADARILMENGSDGLAFGFLTSEGKIDSERTGRMIRLIHEFHGEAVFHRAFDCVEDPYEAIEELIRLGTDRILTSGLRKRQLPEPVF